MTLSAEAIVGLVTTAVALPPAVLGLRSLYIKMRLGEFLYSAGAPNSTPLARSPNSVYISVARRRSESYSEVEPLHTAAPHHPQRQTSRCSSNIMLNITIDNGPRDIDTESGSALGYHWIHARQ